MNKYAQRTEKDKEKARKRQILKRIVFGISSLTGLILVVRKIRKNRRGRD